MNSLVKLFKALADENRVAIIRGLAVKPMYVEVLAERLSLSPATITHHLKKLKEAQIVKSRKEQYYKVYSLREERLNLNLLDLITQLKTGKEDNKEELYQQKVIRSFIQNGRLKSIPVQRKKRSIILKHLAKCFQAEKTYKEKEVNEILSSFHEDYCLIRRELIAEKIMERADGLYNRKQTANEC